MAFPKVLLVSYAAFSAGEFWKETCFSHQLRNKGFFMDFPFSFFFGIIFSFTFFVGKSMNNIFCFSLEQKVQKVIVFFVKPLYDSM